MRDLFMVLVLIIMIASVVSLPMWIWGCVSKFRNEQKKEARDLAKDQFVTATELQRSFQSVMMAMLTGLMRNGTNNKNGSFNPQDFADFTNQQNRGYDYQAYNVSGHDFYDVEPTPLLNNSGVKKKNKVDKKDIIITILSCGLLFLLWIIAAM